MGTHVPMRHHVSWFAVFAVLPVVLTWASPVAPRSSTGSFWIVTDWHIDMGCPGVPTKDNNTRIDPATGSVLELCHTYTPLKRLRPGPFGAFGCASNLNMWHTALAHMKATNPRPDFILWLGDNYGHTQGPDTEVLVLGSTQLLASLLETYFPGVPVVPAVGNHDVWPYNSDPGPAYYSKLCSLWTPLLAKYGIGNAIADCNATGSFAMEVAPDLRVFSLNTQRLNSTEVLPMLDSVLEKAEADGASVLVGAHIPLGPAACYNCSRTSGFSGDVWDLGFQASFLDRMVRYKHTVKGVFSGHTHSDEFRVISKVTKVTSTNSSSNNSMGMSLAHPNPAAVPSKIHTRRSKQLQSARMYEPAVPMFIIPSLPPYNPDTNPAVRLFQYSRGVMEEEITAAMIPGLKNMDGTRKAQDLT